MMNKGLTLGSLFDGSGGFPLAGIMVGIKPIWKSEIEPFPIMVTEKRLPSVKHYGDVSGIKGDEIEPVDIITFGSPCQDMSIAGKRDGLKGSRSNLFYEAIRIIKEMREKTNGKKPRFIVWENVPGAFSSNKGEDFRAVLEEICKIKSGCVSIPKPKKWENAGRIMGESYSVSWRVLDAQHWGVPQRRQRIYLVADFDGGSAGKILFESESVSRYSKACKASQQGTSKGSKESARESDDESLMFENHSQDSRYKGPLDVSQTVAATFGMGGNNQPFVVQLPKTYDVRFTSEGTRNFRANVYETDTSRTIDTGGNAPESNQGGIAVIEGNGARPSHNGDGYKESGVMYTLNATEKHGVAYGIGREAINQGFNAGFSFQITEEMEPTIVASGASGVCHPTYSSSKASHFTRGKEEIANSLVATDYKDPPIINEEDYIVRRLTPTECARLQGFPDWWCMDLGIDNPSREEIDKWKEIFNTYNKATGKSTKEKTDNQIIKWLKNPHSDSAEYKMWGNGIALPNAFFVLAGIEYYSKQSAILL